MRTNQDLKRLRGAAIVLAILLLSLHWTMREDPCAREGPLDLAIANRTPRAVDVSVVILDEMNRTVYSRAFHLDIGQEVSTGSIDARPGTYLATAIVEGDGSGSATLVLDGCKGTARIDVADDRVTIIRSQDV